MYSEYCLVQSHVTDRTVALYAANFVSALRHDHSKVIWGVFQSWSWPCNAHCDVQVSVVVM